MSERYMDLHYYTIGSGFPFVLNHGWSGDGLTYLFQIPFAHDYRLILPDLRGHGKSPKPRTGGVNLMAGDLNKLLDTLGIEKAILCGGSMGGMVSLQFVLDYPERVEALILCDTMSNTPEAVSQFLEEAVTSLEREGVKEGIKKVLEVQYLGAGSGNTPQMDVWVRARAERAGDIEIESLKAITRGLYDFDVPERLPEIRVPTLLIEATKDVLAPSGRLMQQRITGSKLVQIDCGHGSPFFRPDLWNKLVSDFLRKIGH